MSLNGFKPSNQNLNNLKPNSDFCEDSLEIKGPVGSVDKQTKKRTFYMKGALSS